MAKRQRWATDAHRLGARTNPGVALAVLGLLIPGWGMAHVGESFLKIDGIRGDWRGQDHPRWIRSESHYWKAEEPGMFGSGGLVSLRGRSSLRRPRSQFAGPPGPASGPDRLVVTIDKRSPVLRQLMQRCAARTPMPEVLYAEPSVQVRGLRELGPRPAAVPEYWEYRLRDVEISGCPVVADAPEQALVLSFKDIQRLNYSGDAVGVDVKLVPAVLAPLKPGGATKTFVISWWAVAHDVSDKQCPVVNEKPTEDEYYALMSPEAAARERAERVKKGGVGYENGEMELRGPDKLNAAQLPGIVRDLGLATPQPTLARGLDLDGNDGTGRSPPGVCPHRNYRAEDGRTGIDNQLYTVEGCMPGHQGHKGFLMQYSNEQRRNGLVSMLVQVSGIDDERNDDDVVVSLLYSRDPMAKDAGGKQILADYTFRLTADPEYAHYFTRLKARIVNGVIETERLPVLQVNPGLDPEVTLYQGGLRLEILPDGTLKGIAAGYQDWRRIMMVNGNSNAEFHYGFRAPSMYNAFKRNADGLKDPVSGECHGISSAFDIEGVPAFIPPEQLYAQFAPAGGAAGGGG